MTRTILFDMDGVIVDSMAFHATAWQEAIQEGAGIIIPHHLVYESEGKNSSAFIRDVAQRYQTEISEAQFKQIDLLKSKIFLENRVLKIIPGIEDLLRSLSEMGYKLGVATGSSLDIAQQTLFELGFLDYFSTLVTAEDVKNGKPDPEPYQLLLNRLGGIKEQAVVIENAPLGVQSARAAEIFCIAVATTNPEPVLSEASRVLNDLPAVLNFLRNEYNQSQGIGPWQFD